MLEIIGGECAGALSLYPDGQTPPAPDNHDIQMLDERQLAGILEELRARPLLGGENGIRLSLAGAQDKLAVCVEGDAIGLARGGRPTTHILKPFIEELDGTVDVPMWSRTKTHMLVGVYTLSDQCGIAMRSLRAVNVATGRTDRAIALGCDAGMVMTSIYANVTDAQRDGHVTVEFRDSKMGYEQDVSLRLPAGSSK